MTIMVFAEKNSALVELCSGAHQLGDQAGAIMIAPEIPQFRFANKVYYIPAQVDAMLEDYTDTIAALVEKEKPSILLVEPTKRCKLIVGRLAAMLGTSVITDVSELAKDGEAKHMVYGGAAVRKEKAVTSTAIITVGAGVFEPTEPTGNSEVETVNFVEPAFKIKVVGKQRKQKTSVDLTRSKRVVGIGRGLAKKEDLEMIRNFASAIGAEVGCSRPIADGENWMPKETYIGVTGLMLSPDVYFAIGISGQIQHVVGMNQSKTVIAINKDKNAPIYKHADYGIIGDLYKVVPALIEHFKDATV